MKIIFKKTDNTKELQYDNLRYEFNNLVNKILGKDYYNVAQDVYQCDKECCNDIIRKFEQYKLEISLLKTQSMICFIVAIMCMLITFMYSLIK